MICIVAGTNRPQSQTLRIAEIYRDLFLAKGVETTLIDLAKMPQEIFHPSSYQTKPAAFTVLSDLVLKSQGLFVVTPEYNGSFPGVLKYFIDMLPFPASFEKRPVAFCGVAAGMWGALRSVEQLEQIFKYRNAFTFSERVFISKVHEKMVQDGQFKDEFLRGLVDSQVTNFIKFSSALSRELPAQGV
jgi:chromate reductase